MSSYSCIDVENFMLSKIYSLYLEAYQDLKYQASDASCELLSPVSSELFTDACPRLFDGLFVTIELLLLSSILGFIVAILLVLACMSRISILEACVKAHIYCFRATPLLIQLWLVYFGIGSLGGDILGEFWWSILKDAWCVGLIVLVLNTSAYTSEIFLGGIKNLPNGQYEAAIAYGMKNGLATRRILLPQAIRMAWPAYSNELILLMKGSALVSTITVMDLMGQTRTLFSRSYDFSIYFYAAILYLVLAAFITLFVRIVEKRLCIMGR